MVSAMVMLMIMAGTVVFFASMKVKTEMPMGCRGGFNEPKRGSRKGGERQGGEGAISDDGRSGETRAERGIGKDFGNGRVVKVGKELGRHRRSHGSCRQFRAWRASWQLQKQKTKKNHKTASSGLMSPYPNGPYMKDSLFRIGQTWKEPWKHLAIQILESSMVAAATKEQQKRRMLSPRGHRD